MKIALKFVIIIELSKYLDDIMIILGGWSIGRSWRRRGGARFALLEL